MKTTTSTKFELEISNKDIEDAIIAMSDWYRIELTFEQFVDLLKASIEALCEMVRFGPTDTASREVYVGALLETKLGMTQPWPINGDSQERKNSFYKELVLKCKEHGIKFNID